MYQLNETEMWREHHLALLREAEDRRLARRLRRRHRTKSNAGIESGRRALASVGRSLALLGRASVPFFRA